MFGIERSDEDASVHSLVSKVIEEIFWNDVLLCGVDMIQVGSKSVHLGVLFVGVFLVSDCFSRNTDLEVVGGSDRRDRIQTGAVEFEDAFATFDC